MVEGRAERGAKRRDSNGVVDRCHLWEVSVRHSLHVDVRDDVGKNYRVLVVSHGTEHHLFKLCLLVSIVERRLKAG